MKTETSMQSTNCITDTENQMRYISVDELAAILSIARATAYQLAKTDGFPRFQVGKRIIIPLQSFNEWAAKQAENAVTFFAERCG